MIKMIPQEKKDEFRDMMDRLDIGRYIMASEYRRMIPRWARKGFPDITPKCIKVLVASNRERQATIDELERNVRSLEDNVREATSIYEVTDLKYGSLLNMHDALKKELAGAREYNERLNKRDKDLSAQDKRQKSYIKELEELVQARETSLADQRFELRTMSFSKRFWAVFTGIKVERK